MVRLVGETMKIIGLLLTGSKIGSKTGVTGTIVRHSIGRYVDIEA